MQPIERLSERQRAFDYPYQAPQGAFVVRAGHIESWDGRVSLDGRLPVLSVGSNRAPAQLLRKFGPAAEIPVSPAQLHGCDICHVAALSGYAAVPASAFPSPGTRVRLNIAWLDRAQLAIMHRTETVGIAYDFVRWDASSITHLARQLIPASGQPVYGYASRQGFLQDADGAALSLAAITAEQRRFSALDQAAAMARLCQLAGVSRPARREDWIDQLQADSTLRQQIIGSLKGQARHPENPPWQVMTDLLV